MTYICFKMYFHDYERLILGPANAIKEMIENRLAFIMLINNVHTCIIYSTDDIVSWL